MRGRGEDPSKVRSDEGKGGKSKNQREENRLGGVPTRRKKVILGEKKTKIPGKLI